MTVRPALALINYGAGNMASIRNALRVLGIAYEEFEAGPLPDPDHTIALLPGVGSFAQASIELQQRGFMELKHPSSRVIGICLGMQLLFSEGEEGGAAPGLGCIDGEVRSIAAHPQFNQKARLPHVGWQPLRWASEHDREALGAEPDQDVYFVHSYMACAAEPASVLATVEYGDVAIPAVVAHGRAVGFQFHPEKSGPAGLRLLERSIAWLQEQA